MGLMVRPKRPAAALAELRSEWKQTKKNSTGADWEQLKLFEIEVLGQAVSRINDALGDGPAGGGDC